MASYREAVATHGSIRAAARALGVPYSTLHGRLQREAPSRRATAGRRASPRISDLIDARTREFDRKLQAVQREAWQPVTVRESQPFGVLWFGDPHLDDDGCNWRVLMRHVELCASTPGLYGANIGDSTNNWVGRLMRLYAEQETSRQTARELARWFLADSGVKWLCWLMGNHDEWESGADILRLMNTARVPMYDWQAKFELRVPGVKRAIRVHAAHDFPGHSMWNITHGPQRAAKMSAAADLYVCGHKHDWGIQHFEMAGQDRCPLIVRARGYKWIDHYATRNGYQQSSSGAAILTIIDARASDPAGRVTAFADIEQGVRVLNAMRN